jgi:hypothetical protein
MKPMTGIVRTSIAGYLAEPTVVIIGTTASTVARRSHQ